MRWVIRIVTLPIAIPVVMGIAIGQFLAAIIIFVLEAWDE